MNSSKMHTDQKLTYLSISCGELRVSVPSMQIPPPFKPHNAELSIPQQTLIPLKGDPPSKGRPSNSKGRLLPPKGPPSFPPMNIMTNTYENITFPALLSYAVGNQY